jgi:PAS domain S-box-containing protein
MWTRAIFFLGVTFSLLSLTTPLIAHDPSITAAGLTRKSGPLYPLFALYFLATWSCALGICVYKWRHARGQERLRLQYLVAALALSGIGGISVNLVVPLITSRSLHSWIGPHFQLILIALVAHAIIRHRLMDLRLVVHRGLTLAVAMLLSLLPVAVFLTVAWPRLSLHLETHELAAMLAAIAVVGLLIPFIRDVAGRLLDHYVYRTHANYQRTVREASRALTRVLDLTRLLPFLTDTVATSTRAEGVAIYLRDRRGFRRAARDTQPVQEHFEAPDEAPAGVVAALDRTRDLVLSEEMMRERPTEERRQLHDELVRLNWSLVLPLISEDTVIGAIVLGPKLSGDPFYPQDLDLLMTLANQAGVAVKNAQLFAQVVLANEYINSIVATIESGVVAIDAGGQIALFNRAASQLTGLQAEETLSQPVEALPSCLRDALVTSVAEGRALTQPEVELSDGAATRPIICATSPLLDPAGTVLGAVAVFSDLTPLKELEKGRRRAERLAYFEMLASGIAHEIKNPLVAIKTFAQLLPRRHSDAQFIEEFGRIAAREIQRMERLLERLRTLSRPSDRPRQPLDLRLAVAETVETMRAAFEGKSIVVTVVTPQTAAVIRGDHAELGQLFLNLLMNAHEATPPGGTLRVELAVTETHAIVAIRDTGPGVPAGLLDRVFEPFFSTKDRGSGLGLAICAAIAQTHDAKLKVANAPAGGAVFTIEFPLAVGVSAPVSA